MVLFKRKHVQYLPRPSIDNDDAECWIIPETQEVFLSYESYLQRMDWYKSRKFICEISGHSGLSFFDALKSEAQGAKDVDNQFPDALKEPVLRRVQFSTVSRIDNLVDQVFEDFKSDFYPGEAVTVLTEENNRENGVVRDKAKFPEIRNLEGVVTREAFSRYVVSLLERPNIELLVDDHNVSRDRKVFTKQMLRSFIKNTVHRDAWNGAPWLVKQQYAEWYRIDSNVPVHLQYGNKQAERKEKKKSEQDNVFTVWQPSKLPELKPAPKGRKNQTVQAQAQAVGIAQEQYQEYDGISQPIPTYAQQDWQHGMPPPYDTYYIPSEQGHYAIANGQAIQMPPPPILHKHMPKQPPPPPPAPPPIKYPIEDMDIAPTFEKESRPALKFTTKSQIVDGVPGSSIVSGLEENTVGTLLEIWNTLNVYCQVLFLDSFTFDDFVDAMQFNSPDLDCELLVEMHCAVLKKLVNSETDQEGAIQISLPDLPELEDEDEEDEEEESKSPTPIPEPDVPARRTRSSLNKMQLAEEERRKEKTPTPEDTSMHRADEIFQDEYGWVERLQKRDFRNGGWQLILVGLLHQVSGRDRLKESCNKILVHLVPLDAEPIIDTVIVQYSTMDINLRASALQIICQLFLETATVKFFLEEMSNTMTQFRKVKIEHQRARKEAIAKLKVLHEERKQLAPPEKSPSPIPELEDTMEIDRLENGETEIADSDDEEQPVTSRSLRRGHDRAAERKRKREEEQDRKQKAAEEKQNKGSKEYQKVLKSIDKEREKIEEAEEQIETVDGDLREADCPRTRVLGKDRFCNRYWWFERNAMPYGGLPDSSTAEADYANGRLWVQGPDEMERIGYIDVPDEAKNNYFRAFQMTPSERKLREEGMTNLHTAYQWGYYDKPEEVDALIAWLDLRGFRELKLKKELILQRDLICKYMENRAAWLTRTRTEEEPTARMSTRTKTYVSENAPRCLQWQNTSAINHSGHRHVDPPPKPKSKSRKSDTVRVKEPQGSTVLNRQGRPVTRQGTRYNF